MGPKKKELKDNEESKELMLVDDGTGEEVAVVKVVSKDSPEQSLANAIESLLNIFVDGKLTVGEIPAFFRASATVTERLVTLLVFFKVDAKVTGPLALWGQILDNVANNIEAQIPEIKEHWATLNEILSDKDITMPEVVPFINAISRIFIISTKLIMPYVDKDSLNTITAIAEKVKRWTRTLTAIDVFKPWR